MAPLPVWSAILFVNGSNRVVSLELYHSDEDSGIHVILPPGITLKDGGEVVVMMTLKDDQNDQQWAIDLGEEERRGEWEPDGDPFENARKAV